MVYNVSITPNRQEEEISLGKDKDKKAYTRVIWTKKV